MLFTVLIISTWLTDACSLHDDDADDVNGQHCRLSPSYGRCQSARGPSSSERQSVGWKEVDEERQRRREEADAVFDAWLRKKQREAAERRREATEKQKNQSANEVQVITMSQAQLSSEVLKNLGFLGFKKT